MQRLARVHSLFLVVVLAVAGCGEAGRRAATRDATTTNGDGTQTTRARATYAPASVSSNWSGYVVRSKRGVAFTRASGSWRVPGIACSIGAGTSAAFWVGIGGYGNGAPSLEQLGAAADCSPSGETSYALWTEIVPAPPRFVNMAVAPGDVIAATVSVAGQNVTLTIRNERTHTSFSTHVTSARPLDRATAEWVAEAPSICRTTASCEVVHLSDFGTVAFTAGRAAAGGHAGAIADPAWVVQPVVLVASDGASRYTVSSNASGAVPGPLSADGGTFRVAYRSQIAGTAPAHPLPGAPLPPWVR